VGKSVVSQSLRAAYNRFRNPPQKPKNLELTGHYIPAVELKKGIFRALDI